MYYLSVLDDRCTIGLILLHFSLALSPFGTIHDRVHQEYLCE